jgi:hypothetical protein
MAFHNSLQGIMEVIVLHGSSNKLTFKVKRKCVFKIQSFNLSKVQPTIDISWIINNDESDFKPYVSDQIGFAYSGVFINQQSQ